MSYFTSLERRSGLSPLPENPCRLLDLQILALPSGECWAGETGARELLAVFLGGRADVRVGDRHFTDVGGRPNVFGGKPHAVYLPAGAAVEVRAQGPVEIALVSAPSDLRAEPYLIAPERVAGGTWGAANFRRGYHQILTAASQPDLPARRLIVGETFTPSGNWSTYPPHKHEADDLPRQAFHEEIYYFKVAPADGFGIARYYNDQGEEHNYTVRDHTALMVPHGYHTVASAPGYSTYYLWALAGEHRTQAVVEDPALAWVGRTVPMLKELGH
jgi:5-deoxy-glucuronate isomerase